ncbi:MAG: (d)CMP kinase [Ignavibacteriales bacterium]|nr:(d)CMP kinase [Ignavibacteriales bacterium]
MAKKLAVAIDGPAGSGKSVSAKLVADRLGYLYIDTGAMYRAVTLAAIERGVAGDVEATVRLAEELDVRLEYKSGVTRVFADGAEVTEEIRAPRVNDRVSPVAAIDGVRSALVAKQRAMAGENGVVMEGRDVGSVVLPDAEVKVFLVASIEERAKRRAKEYAEKGVEVSIEDVERNLRERDRIDSSRAASPLIKTPDAIEIDTSNLTIEQQVEKITALAVEAGAELV